MTTRGTYRKSESSRRAVVEAGLRCIASQGWAKASVSDIAREAGMSKGAVHYHFESKDDLVLQVLEHAVLGVQAQVLSAWQRPGSPVERLRHALLELRALRTGAAPELRVIGELMVASSSRPALRPPIGALLQSIRLEVERQLGLIVEQLGLVPRLEPAVAARLLLSAVHGMILHDVFDPPSPAMEDQLQQAVEQVAASLL